MKKLIRKLVKNPFIIFLYFRLTLIYNSKRFKRGYFFIKGKKFYFSDSLSFVFMFIDIFINQSYKFKSEVKNPIIIDCGSNIGLSVLYFKTIYPESIIHAFEPDKNIFKILEENCKKFEINNVSLLNKGVWKEDGFYDFLSDGCDGGRMLDKNVAEKSNLVEMVSLKNILDTNSSIDLLKIDIEGAELEVLRSCKDSL